MPSQNLSPEGTLELAVNEQQLQNMSRIDLGRPGADSAELARPDQQQQQQQPGAPADGSLLEALRQWPARLCANLRARLDAAEAKSDTRAQYTFELAHAFSGILVWLLCFIFTIIMPLALLLVGLGALDECPARPSLPYLVFATGFVMTASNLFNLALGFDLPVLSNHSQLSLEIKNTIASILNIIFNCVVAFLYILTAYKTLTMGRTKPIATTTATTNSSSNNNSRGGSGGGGLDGDRHASEESAAGVAIADCNQTLVGLAFWFVTLTLGTIVILSLLGAILFAYNRYRLAIIRGSTPRSQNGQATNGPLGGGGGGGGGGHINTAFYGDSTNKA